MKNFGMNSKQFIGHQERYKDLFNVYLPTEEEYSQSVKKLHNKVDSLFKKYQGHNRIDKIIEEIMSV